MLTRGHERRLISTTPSASCCDRVVAKLTPSLRASSLRASRPPPRTGNHYNEIGDGAAEAILLNFAAPDCSAPTRQGIKRTIPPARNAGEKARRSPRCCFGATPLVAELPRSNGQTTAWPSAPPPAQA